MKKRKKGKIKLFKKLIILSLIAFVIYNYIVKKESKYEVDNFLELSKWQQTFLKEDKMYPVIYEEKNDNYLGKGQEYIYRKNGYFTTFTTVEENKKTYKEYKQNGNSTWKNNSYWNSTMEESGCGITVMATILSGYGYNKTPEDLRNEYYPYLDYSKLSQEFKNDYNIESSQFYYDLKYIKKEKIINHLNTNRPIIICMWNKKDNRWTTTSHYMALLATDNDKVYVSNPNGLYNSSKSSGWYDINEVLPYIAKIMYIYSY